MSSITFINNIYSWNVMSLFDFLAEGNIPKGWEEFFIKNSEILNNISEKIRNEKNIVYPQINNVFRSFIPINNINDIIIGQDPYHNGTTEFDGSAVGYCFSVKKGNNINPSLRNIYKELVLEGYNVKNDGDLSKWAKQGCFLLNTALTVIKGVPDSHTNVWSDFTENVITYVDNNCKNIVWLLMGAKAHHFDMFINKNKIIKTSHPSPFSANRSVGEIPAFIGSNIFKDINIYLKSKGKNEIIW